MLPLNTSVTAIVTGTDMPAIPALGVHCTTPVAASMVMPAGPDANVQRPKGTDCAGYVYVWPTVAEVGGVETMEIACASDVAARNSVNTASAMQGYFMA